MRLHEKNTIYWITKSEYYNKKFNLNIDKAQWEGFRIEIRTATYENLIEKKKEGKDENIIFLFLRRKFIPPFFDTFVDICLILREPYDADDADDVEFSNESEVLIDTVSDSLHFPQKTLMDNEYENILEAKLEALLLDEDSLSFFYNNLKIYGKECYRCGMDYVYYILVNLERQDRENTENIKDLFTNKIKRFNLSINPKFDFNEYDRKYIRNNDIDTIIRDFETRINTLNSTEYFNQVKFIWEVKIWRYLVFCLDGGLTNGIFNLEKLIKIYKISLVSSPTLSYLIQIQLNNMLNIRIFSTKDEVLDSKLITLLTFSSEIKIFSYNETVLNLMMRSGVLKSIQGIENDSNYAGFIKYMLENNPSQAFLDSLLHFLRDISNDMDVSSAEQALRKSLNSILSSLMGIYSNVKLCPINIILACKCLTVLTCSDIDKNNKTKILQDNVVDFIINYLDNKDEKLVFCSLKLLMNILPELQETISEILYKNGTLIPRLINILKGTGVAKCFYPIKTVQSVIIILMNLLKMNVSLVREKLCSVENRVFVKYLLYYINEDDVIGDKVIQLLIPLQKFIFDFLVDVVKKNEEMKEYMQKEYDIIKVLKSEAEKNIGFLRDIVKDPANANKTYGDMIDSILKKLESMLRFSFFFIAGNKIFLTLIKDNTDVNKNYFSEFISFGNEHKTKDLINKLIVPISSLNNEMTNQDSDDEN
jgi:hypothetical protein